MTFSLRPYQQTCHDKLVEYLKSSVEPCVIDAAPAAGKSFLIAAIADFLYKVSGGKRVLCLAPSKELIEQNAGKYRLTGEPCSIFSASAGSKSVRHKVVFGSPLTVKNSIKLFRNGYAGVVIDESHGTTPTIKYIIEEMKSANPMLRVIGFSGTPYRMGDGYIYRIDPDGKTLTDDVTRNPYFMKCVHRVSAREMLDAGFITPMRIGAVNASRYDTSGLHLNRMGQYDAQDVDRAFVGHGRKTAAIVADVVNQSRRYSGGVMLFAATVKHAHEIMASLPPAISAMVTGDTEKKERNSIIKKYKEGEVRYLVSVGTLTTGFDVPHTQVIALLRKTESSSLLTQIMGRAWRLHDGKEYSVLLDYAENIEEHFPDGDIYSPVIKAGKEKGEAYPIKAKCPACSYENTFSCLPDYIDTEKDENGYCVDVFGNRIETEYGPLSSHYGRRCFGYVPVGQGKLDRCNYRWSGKPCPACDEPNDIAARYCYVCKAEIIDPNLKLVGEFKEFKKDPYQPQCDEVLSMDLKQSISRAGNSVIKVDWVTPFRAFTTYFMVYGKVKQQKDAYKLFMLTTDNGNVKPDTVSYRKTDDKFYSIIGYNLPKDEEPKKGIAA
mgnify:CR=1 FL=1